MLSRVIALAATAVLVAALVILSSSPTSAQVDVSGFWHLHIGISTFSASTECDAAFEQSGTDINGSFNCDSGTGTLTGTLANSNDIDAALTLTVTGGTHIEAHAQGAVSQDGQAMNGTWHSDILGGVDGTFQGTRLNFPKGDLNCDQTVDGRDGIVAFVYLAGLTPHQANGCPRLTTGISHLFGDMDCDGHVTAQDGLEIIRYISGLPADLPLDCPPLGQ